MPSDEMVEKAQTLDDAIDNALIAWGMGWDMDGVMACLKEAKDRAALSAASAEPQPVAWRTKRHPQEIGHALTDAGTIADEWERRGFAVEPLYTYPPSEAAIRADERAAIRKEAFEEAAKVVEPKEPRPCDCTRCYCGNGTDAQEVAAWDEATAAATAIRARGEAPTNAKRPDPA